MKYINDGNVLYIQDLYYQNLLFHIQEKCDNVFDGEWTDRPLNSEKSPIVLDEPYLIIETIDSCYSHALLERIFPLFWAMDKIRSEYPDLSPIRIMIRNRMIRLFPNQNKPLIDRTSGYYRGFHRELLGWITSSPPLFPSADRTYCFRHAFLYTDKHDYQCSPWNQTYMFPNRQIKTPRTLYHDDLIREYLVRFREFIFRYYHIHLLEEDLQDKILLIERKSNRRWDPETIRSIPAIPVILEDLPIRQQIILFATHKTIIFRHGSCLANLIFSPPGAKIFDLDHEYGRPHIVGRLCQFFGLRHIYLEYGSCRGDWFASNHA